MTKTTDIKQVRTFIAKIGNNTGSCGTFCGFLEDWSEQHYERGSVRRVLNRRTGQVHWLLFERN